MSNQNLLLSIILPVYNVEEYIIECLESLDKSIKNIAAEVIMVDDGSSDNSTTIIKEYADDHSEFLYFRKENGGLSSARNYGLKHANGKYIAFVNSEDIVEEDMFENLINSADYHDADMTICNVARYKQSGPITSQIHRRVFENIDTECTHISKDYNMLYDITVFNKLIKKSFLDSSQIEFTEGSLFEDMVVSYKLHNNANKVAIVQKVGYLWRISESNNIRISQGDKLEYKLAMMKSEWIDIKNDYGETHPIMNHYKMKCLEHDLKIFLNESVDMNDESSKIVFDAIIDFIDGYVGREHLKSLSPLHKLMYECIINNDRKRLSELREFEQKFLYQTRIFKEDDSYKLAVPKELFSVDRVDAQATFDKTIPLCSFTRVEKNSNEYVFDGYLYIHRLDIPDFDDQKINAYLFNETTGASLQLESNQIDNHEATNKWGFVFDRKADVVTNYNYDGTGFSIRLNLEDISTDQFIGNNFILLRYENEAKRGIQLLKLRNKDELYLYEGIALANENIYSKIDFDADNKMIISLSKNNNQYALKHELTVDTDKNIVEYTDSYLNKKELSFVSLAYLKDIELEDNTVKYKVAVTSNMTDNLNNVSAELFYYDSIQGKDVTLATSTHYNNQMFEFNVDFSDKQLNGNLYETTRIIKIKVTDGHDVYENDILSLGDTRLLFEVNLLKVFISADKNNKLILTTRNEWNEDEDTIDKRRYYKKHYWKKLRKLPVDDKCVVFEAFWGAKYSCNPQAFYEYIDENHKDYKCIWVLTDPRIPIKGNGIRVRRSTREYCKYMSTARYLVNNVNFEPGYKKRVGQIEIQTMHGTPYKSYGLDVKEDVAKEANRRGLIKRNNRWNFLIVQGKFMESKAWDVLRFDKDILKTGYPRTDKIINYQEKDVIAIKHQMKLPLDKKIILYAPTYRIRNYFEMKLDVEKFREKFSDDYVLLIRPHHFVTSTYKVPEDKEFVFDASSYQCIEDLYIITDVLITDYSSVMFDYSLTNKPLLFFTYDLEDYKNQRGVYFDITTEAPGPVVTTNDELIEIIENIDNFNDTYKSKIGKFKNKYVTYENGQSSKMVFDTVFLNKGRKMKYYSEKIYRKLFMKRFLKKEKERLERKYK